MPDGQPAQSRFARVNALFDELSREFTQGIHVKNSPLATSFGERLKQLRKTTGFSSQKALAECSGITASGIAQMEKGRLDPAWSTVVALARALGVSPGAFAE